MANEKEVQKQSDGFTVDNSGYLVEIQNGDKYIRMCPFSEGSIRNHGSDGVITQSEYLQKSQCGHWCALFEEKPEFTIGGITYPGVAILNCGSKRIITLVDYIT